MGRYISHHVHHLRIGCFWRPPQITLAAGNCIANIGPHRGGISLVLLVVSLLRTHINHPQPLLLVIISPIHNHYEPSSTSMWLSGESIRRRTKAMTCLRQTVLVLLPAPCKSYTLWLAVVAYLDQTVLIVLEVVLP